jgi:hypothetical protein
MRPLSVADTASPGRNAPGGTTFNLKAIAFCPTVFARIESPVEESHVDWDRSPVRLDVATALIHQPGPDVEHAADVALAALRASAGNPIESVRHCATEFVTEACRWQTRPAMREFTEALHGLTTTTLPAPAPGPEAL